MKNPSPPTSFEHPDALLLPYLENMISPEEKASLKEHLAKCHECAQRVEELRRTIVDLKHNKEAFCPEPWELYDFARSGSDPHGVIGTHVENCPLCSEDLRAWTTATATAEEQMPPELWSRLRERLPGLAHEAIPQKTPRWYQILLGNLARFWKMPTLAAGAAAAVLLLVVIFYRPMEPMGPIPKSLPQKTAFVVLLKDFKDPALQKQIESIGEALSRSSELKDRYTVVSPKETSELIESGKVPLHDESAMVERLRKSLNVSRALIISVLPSADTFGFRVELVDTMSPKILQTKTDEKIEQNNLAERIQSDVLKMLLQPDDKP